MKDEFTWTSFERATKWKANQARIIALQKELEELSDKQDTLEFVMGISLRTESGKHKHVDNILEKF